MYIEVEVLVAATEAAEETDPALTVDAAGFRHNVPAFLSLLDGVEEHLDALAVVDGHLAHLGDTAVDQVGVGQDVREGVALDTAEHS